METGKQQTRNWRLRKKRENMNFGLPQKGAASHVSALVEDTTGSGPEQMANTANKWVKFREWGSGDYIVGTWTSCAISLERRTKVLKHELLQSKFAGNTGGRA